MKLIIAIIATIATFTVAAQTKNPNAVRQVEWTITCATTEYVIDFLKEYEERPVLAGKMGKSGRMAMLINTETGTWTLIGYTERGACIMASGEDVQQLDRPNRSLK
jgi:hypothetical protein